MINMKNYVEGILVQLEFNIDEVDSSDWEDRKPKKILIPSDMAYETVFHAVFQRFRHVTSLTCISAAVKTLYPMVIIANPISDGL
jgi:hypothetical protein